MSDVLLADFDIEDTRFFLLSPTDTFTDHINIPLY